MRVLYSLFGLFSLCVEYCSGNLSVTERKYSKVVGPSYGSDRLGPAWTAFSLAECFLKCNLIYSSRCQTIMYNSATRLCTPGSFLKAGISGAALAPRSIEGNLFAPSLCDTRDGFVYATSPDASACIMVSTTAMYHHDARDFCSNLGAHLFTGRTLAKYYLLPPPYDLFIGLSDSVVEGKLVWEDNGKEINWSFRQSLFKPGEPNNNWDEDCVYVSTGVLSNFANDARCFHVQARFVCERPFLS